MRTIKFKSLSKVINPAHIIEATAIGASVVIELVNGKTVTVESESEDAARNTLEYIYTCMGE